MHLFDSLKLRDVTLRNRIAVSPMCEYSSTDGFANQWHLVHLGSRAVGGAGLVFTEAAAVTSEGRISPADLGIYKDEHVEKLREIVDFVHSHGAIAGIQLAHAGFKASTAPPWDGGGPVAAADGGWLPIYSACAQAFKDGWIVPQSMSAEKIEETVAQFAVAAKRAVRAGFRVAEIHAAHGYLLHEFLSPVTNKRTDAYGGSFENRIRFVSEVVKAVRSEWPQELPLFVRLSAIDWLDDGWNIADSVRLGRILKGLGVDLIDASSGGISPHAKIGIGPGYQVPFAQEIRAKADIATGAVGLITQPHQAQEIIETGKADIVLLARELLRQPYWPLHAAAALGSAAEPLWPRQYLRASPGS
ncbi:MAG: NADH:flavin oxidoreductase/NADH oxidase [Candidatus Eremiobacteraeota bacterium]|nr:NADH:flavin oxidoreductase/NADH oxidase [Candidatus Eremiobacteraeota bacterium]